MSGVSREIQDLAEHCGVALHYSSFWGEEKQVGEHVLRRALGAMKVSAAVAHEGFPITHVVTQGSTSRVEWHGGPHPGPWQLSLGENSLSGVATQRAIELPGDLAPGYWQLTLGDETCLVIVAPSRCWTPPELDAGERWWGYTVQLYALRSSHDWGIGDFGDLRRFVEIASRQGASFVGLSPLHSLFPHRPEVASPYSPSSRNALNPIYLDVQLLLDQSGCREASAHVHSDAFQERLHALRASELVDYAGVARAKEEVLLMLWRHFEAKEIGRGTARGAHFEAFAQERENSLGRHALFEVLQAHFFAQDANVWGWPAWPEEYRDANADCVKAFAREHVSQVRFRLWLQWLAQSQLENAQRYARTRGMGLGLYCDLAVGVNEGGSETWVQPQLYALGMHVGAPPDPLNALGQDWGLPPVNPVALEQARFAPWIETLRSNMRHAGALRLDHVMALMRLFWTHEGEGTYVRYPLDALLAILAVESHRHECMVIGEDLGNVAPRMREAMAEKSLLSYRPLLFERAEDGSFKPPAQWVPHALAVVSTHDLPTLRGFWLGEDMQVLAQLNLYPNDAARDQHVVERAQDRARLLIALEREGLLPPGASVQPTSIPDATPAFVDAVYAYLARTPCSLVGVQLEDVTGQLLQVNVPGTMEDQFPNWRRKLSATVDELASDPRFASLASVLRAERSGPAPADSVALDIPPLSTARIPVATYRVQFHKLCTFEQVTRAVPYLHALGISHLYSSPYLRARPGSTHGYDIVDHNALNPEVGDARAFDRMCEALRSHGMSQIIDVVPNHMGVLEADNAWWLDVLENGPASAHAQTFDIEWRPPAAELNGKILLPVLGDHYGRVLEAGEIQLNFDVHAGEFSLHYWDHRFRIDPAHYPDIFDVLSPPPARSEAEADGHAVVAALLSSLRALPPRDAQDESAKRARSRDAAVYKQTLARLARRHEWLAHWIAACVDQLNGRIGEPSSFDALDQLISRQAYRLTNWRVASDDVNYRRFFDVNTLAGIRMEQPAVFEATHRLVLRWLRGGQVAGLRIDHPDGLSDPQQYFERLQCHYAREATVAGHEPRALYLVVEKILAEHEQLPESWPVHGDTGYRFCGVVNDLFVDSKREEEVDRLYRSFTGETQSFDEIVYRCKKIIIYTSLFSELRWLATAIHQVTRANRRTCDFTRPRLRVALAETAAAFPVYRTYLRANEPASASDRQHIDWAIAAAKRRLGGAEAAVLDHLRDMLLGEGEAVHADPAQRERFIARWQQFTAPVMAKAMEDTAFYRYVRLLSLNEVGSDPRTFGISPAAFHSANQTRLRYRSHSMLATSTHDSKRAEDLRARLNVLSEDPVFWDESLQRFHHWAERYTTPTANGPAPTRSDIWLLFQTLVGMWPAEQPDDSERDDLRHRVQAYMLKAIREAKLNTSWTSPVPEYEDAMERFVDALLRTGHPNPFVDEIERLVARIAPFGFRNSLAQLTLKFTVPGVPDLYQGSERWTFSLVDPDNRQPVDFARLASDLASLRRLGDTPNESQWRELWTNAADGLIKHLITWRLLQLRGRFAQLFECGGYTPLALSGEAADHAVAFARHFENDAVVVIAARLTYTLCSGEDSNWSPALWHDTQVDLAADALSGIMRWRNWLTGESHEVPRTGDATLGLESVFAKAHGLPFVVLHGSIE
jgi:(1->4)-alpha-D-glucan 1-alpha-D-glucosylmutase